MENKKLYHYCYKTTCVLNDNFYIGVHSTRDLEDGYLGSGNGIKESVKKFGKDNHTKEILKFFNTKNEAFEYEEELVDFEMLSRPLCLNRALGGKFKHKYNELRYSNIDKFQSLIPEGEDYVFIPEGVDVIEATYPRDIKDIAPFLTNLLYLNPHLEIDDLKRISNYHIKRISYRNMMEAIEISKNGK
jgi:hypothetical protein